MDPNFCGALRRDGGVLATVTAMQLAVYAHPFDLTALTAHGGLSRLADLGVSEVAMAVSYHDGRWLQPWNDAARVRFLEDGTVHYRPDPERDYGPLTPQPSGFVPSSSDAPSPLAQLCHEAGGAGLTTRAWTASGWRLSAISSTAAWPAATSCA